MSKKVALVGHCGPDASYLRLAVSRAVKDAQVVFADDQHALKKLIDGGVDLILFNRSPADKFGFPRLMMVPMEQGRASGEVVGLSMNILSINNVDYSPDGFWLTFEYSGGQGSDVYYMTVTGAEKTELAPDPAEDFDPTWQPLPSSAP